MTTQLEDAQFAILVMNSMTTLADTIGIAKKGSSLRGKTGLTINFVRQLIQAVATTTLILGSA